MKIFLIPGLAFDHRVFKNLNFDPTAITYLDWITPRAKESFQHYAQRLAEPISQQTEPVMLIGHSLGGMIAQEISRFHPIEAIFLISSIRSRAEIPFFFKSIQPLRLYKLFTKQTTLSTFKWWAKSHDYETKEEQALFKDMVNTHSNDYLQWALKELSTWQTPQVPVATKVFQLHGVKDKTFPFKLIKNADLVIPQGGHFMVYKYPELISQFIIQKQQKIIQNR